MKLKNNELKMIVAGTTFSATLLNAIIRGVNSFMDVGRYLGSSVRRYVGNGKCALK